MTNRETESFLSPEYINDLGVKYDDTLRGLFELRLQILGKKIPESVATEDLPYALESMTLEAERQRLNTGGESKNEFLILQGASGSGKGTIGGVLEKSGVTRFPRFTDRQRRPDEVDGRDYKFISREEFSAKLEKGDFIGAPAETYGERRGIDRTMFLGYLKQSKPYIDGSARTPIDFLSDNTMAKHKFLSVYILTPGFKVLVERLNNRTLKERSQAADELMVSSDTQLAKRLEESVQHLDKAKKILSGRPVSDIFVVNDDFKRATAVIEGLI